MEKKNEENEIRKFKIKALDVLQAEQKDSSKNSQHLLQGVIDMGGSFPETIILEGEPLKEYEHMEPFVSAYFGYISIGIIDKINEVVRRVNKGI